MWLCISGKLRFCHINVCWIAPTGYIWHITKQYPTERTINHLFYHLKQVIDAQWFDWIILYNFTKPYMPFKCERCNVPKGSSSKWSYTSIVLQHTLSKIGNWILTSNLSIFFHKISVHLYPFFVARTWPQNEL